VNPCTNNSYTNNSYTNNSYTNNSGVPPETSGVMSVEDLDTATLIAKVGLEGFQLSSDEDLIEMSRIIAKVDLEASDEALIEIARIIAKIDSDEALIEIARISAKVDL